jgi:dihydrofolate synthase/folylpolyglutamate synthase
MPPSRSLAEWESYIQTLHARTIDLSLDRVRAVLEAMGLQDPPFHRVAVAGTNGKGSSVAMLEAILDVAGYRVGAYTSPHLVRYNERVRIARRPRSDAVLCEAFERVERGRGDVTLTYFEFGTVAALEAFRLHGIDVAVLEVGLGGRLDAVNAVDADAALVTSIGVDHVQWLGPDRERIGAEKAGIFRSGRCAVCADPLPPRSVEEEAARCGARLHRLGHEFGYSAGAEAWQWWHGGARRTALPHPAMRGAVQLQNAAGVLMVLDCLGDLYPVTQKDVREGLLSAVEAGRFQTLPGLPARILDVAHNPDAVGVLRDNLASQPCSGRTIAVCGMLGDKAIEECMARIAPQIDEWMLAALSHERGASAETLLSCLHNVAPDARARLFPDPESAYRAACEAATAVDRVVVFGSFYTVGDIMRIEPHAVPGLDPE